jgi:hypothetical protein
MVWYRDSFTFYYYWLTSNLYFLQISEASLIVSSKVNYTEWRISPHYSKNDAFSPISLFEDSVRISWRHHPLRHTEYLNLQHLIVSFSSIVSPFSFFPSTVLYFPLFIQLLVWDVWHWGEFAPSVLRLPLSILIPQTAPHALIVP